MNVKQAAQIPNGLLMMLTIDNELQDNS